MEKSSNSYNNADPQSPANPGSGDNPSDLFQQQLFQENGGKPLFNFGKLNGSGDQDYTFSSLPTPIVAGLLPEIKTATSKSNFSTSRLYLERYRGVADSTGELE